MIGRNGLVRLRIDRLGPRGEGIGDTPPGPLHVPYAVPGDLVTADVEADRGTLVGLVEAGRDRIEPFCPYFTQCGGCAIQSLAPDPYAVWKRGLVVDALARAGVDVAVGPLVDAHGAGRRRATFHARTGPDGRTRVGFMQARAHAVVPLEHCPILDPGLNGALAAARGVAAALSLAKPLDIVATATEAGLDIDLRGHGPLSRLDSDRLTTVAMAHGLARLSNHGVIVLERHRPTLRIGAAIVEPPPGAFLQATAAGEDALSSRVVAALAGRRRVADLFAGLGTFALRLAEHAEVNAFDADASALAALDRAGRAAPQLRAISTERRDLFDRPLVPDEIDRFDALVIDPPRAGAAAQMRALARSKIGRIASVSCDAATFARDTAILVAAGFVVETVEPVDQFRHSAHVEIVGLFRRDPPRKKRRLLG